MKKIIFSFSFLLLGLISVTSQSFGVKAGYHNLIVSVEVDVPTGSESDSDGMSGFYVGVFGEFKISDKFFIQPEIQYARVSEDEFEINSLILPLLAKYYVVDKLSLQAGPLFDLILDRTGNLNSFGMGLAFGAAYDITDEFFVSSHYSAGLTNRTDDAIFVPELGTSVDVTTKFDVFQIGIGYRFN